MNNCLTEDNLIELYYGEEPNKTNKKYLIHLSNCEKCKIKYNELKIFLDSLNMDVNEKYGKLALAKSLSAIGLTTDESNIQQKLPQPQIDNEILTISEAASYLKVNETNVRNMLHLIPHFVFDGNIRIRKEKLVIFINELENNSNNNNNKISPTLFLKREII
jgi:hypothetical protein